jgi:hypothetical protein
VIPNGVRVIRPREYFRSRLTYVVIPDSVTEIGGHAFDDNNLIGIRLPNGITVIEWGAFADNQIANVVIPDSVTSIRHMAFERNNLTSIVIPNSVTVIGVSAFLYNDITNITIGANVLFDRGSDFAFPWLPVFENGFDKFYQDNGRKAGKYIFINGTWTIDELIFLE